MSFEVFMLVYAALCATFGGLIATVMNYDRIAVFLLRAINAPVYESARYIAASIYQHPEQWLFSRGDTLTHETLGKIQFGYRPSLLSLDNPAFGKWEPNPIERRIIANAVQWHRQQLIRKALS